jgi:hypothetical protein
MGNRFGSARGWSGHELLGAEGRCLEAELRRLREVNGSLIQEALNKWAELWDEFEDRVVCGVMILPEAGKGFKPRCGWPEFLEKMWQLKLYLDSARSFCEGKR